MGVLYVVGLGPGDARLRTPEATNALSRSSAIGGYSVYLDLIREEFPEKAYFSTPMRGELARCRMALSRAAAGETVSLVCSGDAGVYGMAGPVLSLLPEYPGAEVVVVPGLTAALSGAAVLGAPLTNDFCVVSLSDLLTPWETIEKRLLSAAAGDFALVLYNPASRRRSGHLQRAVEILLSANVSPSTCCGFVRNIGREGEEKKFCTLAELLKAEVDMFTTVFIGNSRTRMVEDRLVTERGYAEEERDAAASGEILRSDEKDRNAGCDEDAAAQAEEERDAAASGEILRSDEKDRNAGCDGDAAAQAEKERDAAASGEILRSAQKDGNAGCDKDAAAQAEGERKRADEVLYSAKKKNLGTGWKASARKEEAKARKGTEAGKVLIFGGTTEGRQLAEELSSTAPAGEPRIFVSVATPAGAEELSDLPKIRILVGRRNAEAMRRLFADFALVVDATHPYAVEASQNIQTAAKLARIPCVRLLREAADEYLSKTQRTSSAEAETAFANIRWVDSVAEAAAFLKWTEGNILITTGAKELAAFNGIAPGRIFARVLPVEASLEACRELGLPMRNVLALWGPFSEELNLAMLRDYRISWLVTKDGGRAGGFYEKLSAANAAGVGVVAIRRPQESGIDFAEALKACREVLAK